MIKNIKKLKGLGIFKDCNNSLVSDFKRLNLIYGWNGSGKSTLTILFEAIEKQMMPAKFPYFEFIATHENSNNITHNNLAEKDINIHVFNQNFIKENIDWDNSVSSILLVAKEKIEERKKLDNLKVEQINDENEISTQENGISSLESDISKFMTKSAKTMKVGLQAIDTSDNYYLNYNKRRLETFIDKNETKVKNVSSLLSNSKIIELTNSSKPEQKTIIVSSQKTLSENVFTKAEQRLNELFKTSAASKTIKRLTENSNIQSWVLSGLDIHKLYDTHTCEFCGNDISEQRFTEIEGHFNDEYMKFKENLLIAEQWLEKQYVQIEQLPSESELYDELKDRFRTASLSLGNAAIRVNNEIKIWQQNLKKKIDNAFDTSLNIESISKSSIMLFNETVENINQIITKHNNKTENFEVETNKSKMQLELHYAATEVKDFGYFDKINSVAKKKIINQALKNVVAERKIIIQKLEAALSNEGLGADKFNESLHKFIGRSELSLHFNEDIKGYEIIRNNTGVHDGDLSEGEKTAIAFVYFITKLKENDNKITESIIVVDDPVSSFDSNHLFHSYSFLRNHCQEAKQLFVLTHNFTYFKLVRDWFHGNNQNRLKKGKPKVASFYTIETTVSNPRCSKLVDADSSLIDYNSEYHYIFEKLYKYKDNNELDRDEAFLTANLSRKLLESFFSFKYPRSRSDISQLLDQGLSECKITDSEIKEKIYRFINKYSHSAVIEINEDSSENLMGESYSVIKDIFKWIKEVDSTHYNEMVSVITV